MTTNREPALPAFPGDAVGLEPALSGAIRCPCGAKWSPRGELRPCPRCKVVKCGACYPYQTVGICAKCYGIED